MKIKEIEALGLSVNETDISLIRVAENHFFGQHGEYRTRAIDFCVKHRQYFDNTENNTYEMVGRYIKVVCPKCKRNMKRGNGSGCTGHHSTSYRCDKCKIEANLGLSNGDLSFGFRED